MGDLYRIYWPSGPEEGDGYFRCARLAKEAAQVRADDVGEPVKVLNTSRLSKLVATIKPRYRPDGTLEEAWSLEVGHEVTLLHGDWDEPRQGFVKEVRGPGDYVVDMYDEFELVETDATGIHVVHGKREV